MPIITVANQKGGVGKTTTVMNLGCAVARRGRRVLLVDSDPQANLTSYLGVTPFEGDFTDINTLDEMYLSKRPADRSAREAFIRETPSGVDLIAADRALSGVEYYLFSRQDKELILRRFLDGIKDRYDLILIDTPPSLNLLTLNALCASNHVLIPVQPEFFSLEGIVKIRQTVEDIRGRWNDVLDVLGVLPTQVSGRRKLTKEVVSALREELGGILFESTIRDNAAVTESSGHAKPVFDYQKSAPGALDYLSAAAELEKRLGWESEADSESGLKLDLDNEGRKEKEAAR